MFQAESIADFGIRMDDLKSCSKTADLRGHCLLDNVSSFAPRSNDKLYVQLTSVLLTQGSADSRTVRRHVVVTENAGESSRVA